MVAKTGPKVTKNSTSTLNILPTLKNSEKLISIKLFPTNNQRD